MSTTTDSMVKACTTKELAAMYGISPKTLRTWLLPHRTLIGEKRSKYYNARQVRVIFQCIGEPG